MSHNNDLSFGIRIFLDRHSPELAQILIKLFVVFILVREWIPAFLKWPNTIRLHEILDASSKSNNDKILSDLEHASM